MKKNILLYVTAGILVAGFATFLYTTNSTEPSWDETYNDGHDHVHNEEVHVHADFLMYLDGQQVDLTQDKYQSSTEDVKLEDFHLHDNEGNILHRHAEDMTIGQFLASIGFTFTPPCITTDEGVMYCEDETNELSMYINGVKAENPDSYVLQDIDQILLYYGERNNEELQAYQERVTDEACIYSGTCPERGTPPPESCGLTCEI